MMVLLIVKVVILEIEFAWELYNLVSICES